MSWQPPPYYVIIGPPACNVHSLPILCQFFRIGGFIFHSTPLDWKCIELGIERLVLTSSSPIYGRNYWEMTTVSSHCFSVSVSAPAVPDQWKSGIAVSLMALFCLSVPVVFNLFIGSIGPFLFYSCSPGFCQLFQFFFISASFHFRLTKSTGNRRSPIGSKSTCKRRWSSCLLFFIFSPSIPTLLRHSCRVPAVNTFTSDIDWLVAIFEVGPRCVARV